jgi:hypothetical protein
MAKQRIVNTHFWDDGYIVTLDPIEKLLFLYFLTNSLTNIAGAYEINLRRIAFDTGIDRDMIFKILERFEAVKKIYYRDGWVVIPNFIKHQSPSPKIVSGIRNELSQLPKGIADLINCDFKPKTKTRRGKITPAKRKRILDRDGHCCQFCQSTNDLEIDHINPVILGGNDADDNLRVLCQACNGKRNAELRWNATGDVESKNSLPIEMGGLSHLNSIKYNTNSIQFDGPPPVQDKKTEWTFPMSDLIASFPEIDFAPGAVGFIEAEVKDTPVDREAWKNTILRYRQNYDPMTKSYLPTKVGNLLGVFRDEKKKLQNGTTKNNNYGSKRTDAEVLAESAEFYANYPEQPVS